MKKFSPILLLLFLAISFIAPAHAIPADKHYDQIIRLNAGLSKRNYFYLQDFIGRKITDSTNRVVGEIKDVHVGRGGIVESILAEFDDTSAGRGIYAINSRLLQRSMSGSFSLPFHRDDAGRFVSEIEPAAGGDAMTKASSLVGARVEGSEGQNFGVVESMLLDVNGSRFFALNVIGKRGKAENFVLPINNGLRSKGRRIILESAYTRALEQFLRE